MPRRSAAAAEKPVIAAARCPRNSRETEAGGPGRSKPPAKCRHGEVVVELAHKHHRSAAGAPAQASSAALQSHRLQSESGVTAKIVVALQRPATALLRPAKDSNEAAGGFFQVSRPGKKLKLASLLERDCWHQPNLKRHQRNI